MFFRNGDGVPITNFPKQHLRNGNRKDWRTGRRFKQVIRVAKHARRLAVEQGLLDQGAAPSYLIECLFYNVPDHIYRTTLPEAFCGSLGWLRGCRHDEPDRFAALRCQNELIKLFGPGPDQWKNSDAADSLMLDALPHVQSDRK